MSRGRSSTPQQLFAGNPAAFRLYKILKGYIQEIGPVQITTTKTQVSFGLKTKFAWVWLPQMWIKKQPENSVVLTIGLRRRIKDRRIKESMESYPGRFVHHIVILGPSDLDAKVKGWLREAYGLGLMGRGRTRLLNGNEACDLGRDNAAFARSKR